MDRAPEDILRMEQENAGPPTVEVPAVLQQAIIDLDRLAGEFTAGWDRIEKEAEAMRQDSERRYQLRMAEIKVRMAEIKGNWGL